MPFKDEFNEDQARDFYISVRCGLLHEARTKNGWTIWAKHGSRIIDATGAQKILYRDDFQKALCPKPKGGFLSSWNLSEHFRCYFAMGKIRGTPCMWRHISAHGATTKYFSNSFVFNTKIEKEGLPGDSPAGLGAGGPRFKSARPDPKYLACILLLIESAVHLKPHLWNSGRQEVWIRKSFSFGEFAT